MQKSQMLGKYLAGLNYSPKTTSCLAGSNYSPKTTSEVINNNLSDNLVKSNYGKVLQTALYQQNFVDFLSSKRGGGGNFDPRTPPWCATATNSIANCEHHRRIIYQS